MYYNKLFWGKSYLMIWYIGTIRNIHFKYNIEVGTYIFVGYYNFANF